MKEKMKVILGDITEMDTEAIVNAANRTLLGGGGVDGAIHRKAGPNLLKECRNLDGCETGKAKITKGYELPAEYVIHTVGPIYSGDDKKDSVLLESCYRSAFEVLRNNYIKSISFPSISTGAYRYPLEKACPIAIKTVADELKRSPGVEKILFVCFDRDAEAIYKENMKRFEE